MNGAPRSAAQENLERHPICRQCTRRRPLHRLSGVGVAARRPAAAASGRPISANPGPSAGSSREGSCRSCLLVRPAWVRSEHRHARRCGAQVATGLVDARRRTGRQCVRGACGGRAGRKRARLLVCSGVAQSVVDSVHSEHDEFVFVDRRPKPAGVAYTSTTCGTPPACACGIREDTGLWNESPATLKLAAQAARRGPRRHPAGVPQQTAAAQTLARLGR